MPLASLAWHAKPAHAGVVVLVMHGGAVNGRQVNRAWSHNVIRLAPFGWALARVPGPIAVARLRFRYRGWNGGERSPLVDAARALEQVRAAYPGRPIALVGHSMGGRVALHLGGEPDVRLVVGLAPWIAGGDPRPPKGCRTVLIHGDRDIICPVGASRRVVETLIAEGRDAALIRVARSDRAMLLRARVWTALVVGVVEQVFATELGRSGERRVGAGAVDTAVTTALRRGEVVDI